MKVSVNWIRLMNQNYGCSDSSELDDIDKLLEKIGLQLGAIEGVVDLGERYKGIVVAKVVSAEKHPGADKLSLCLINDGGVVKNVKRDENDLVQVVCGAPNVKAGMQTAWIPPGTTVPSTFDKEPLVIEAREIRGQMSNGMLASLKELAIGDSHEGILEIDQPAKPGQPIVELYHLNDHVIDIENKMFTHRPDCFGLLGVARELAGISGKPYKSPDWYREDVSLTNDGRKNVLKLEVKNELPKLVPRFCAVVIKDVKIGPSPAWLQSFLDRSGIRPINNIVDITNWFMLATAQPLHAYDYDKVKTGVLGVRMAKKGEKLNLLNGKTISLDEQAVVITDGEQPIGLGGVMGGADTEVDENTKNIVLECANFDMNITRKTAMRYGLFTDAATRFTKNQSPRQNRAVLVKTAHDTLRLVGGRLASPIIDDKHFSGKDMVVKTDSRFINARLGTQLKATEIKKLLENVEFMVSVDGEKVAITAPFWRTDIEIPEDIVEEVGRLYGYDKLPVVLPRKDLAPAQKDAMLSFKSRLRDILVRAGANEVLTYSFVHGSLMDRVGQDPGRAYHIRNALSPDLQYFRQSLTPSLLEKVHSNIKAGYDEFALFEIGKGHIKGLLNSEGVPKELERLSLVFASRSPKAGAPYFEAKRLCDYLLSEVGISEVNYEALERGDGQTVTYYDSSRVANIRFGGKTMGRIGEYKPTVRSALKLPAYSAGFELYTDELLALTRPVKYRPLNRFPELEQDFCLRSSTGQNYQELTDFMVANLETLSAERGYQFRIKPLDVFQKPNDKQHKQTTWRIVLSHPLRTLTNQEVNHLMDQLAAQAKKVLSAERI
ncbi:MAG TPA: phenylalanine--tRNA ligase subunit beta [Candidatus Saccharimonadales bacterium]|nr:phenylalanine--tRNA ligase subunit beta [Candidatus Saccharimonadales bacterium]